MEFAEALRRRRMVRRFTGDSIDHGQAHRIAAAGLRAPSAGNAQGVTVVVVSDRKTIGEMADACGEADYVARGYDPWLSSAASHLVLSVDPERYRARYAEPDKDPSALEVIPWWWVDAGAALMAMLLAAVAEGLAAGFHGAHRAGAIKDLLGIPDHVELVGVVAVGHPAPDRRSKSLDRPSREDSLRHERW